MASRRRKRVVRMRRFLRTMRQKWRPWPIEPPPFIGYRPTPRRALNLWLNRIEHRWVRTRLWSHPIKLIVEPINACNLRCPYCFTGAGGQGRARSGMSLDLYRTLLAELGPYLFEVEAFNWGEPLLSPHLPTMIAAATARGIATKVNTNFSLPFDAAAAERLIAAGLTRLTVSIDGARQETYEQYRVRGDLATVLANCRLMVEAKRRLGSPTPILNWEFHVFPHNAADVPTARAMARRLGVGLLVFKGTVPGPDWDVDRAWRFCVDPREIPCVSLWAVAVVNNDGGVSPCNGTFFRQDDIATLALRPDALAAAGFGAVWNGARFQAARRFYRARSGTPVERAQICFDCPQTIIHERWKMHRAAGGTATTFRPGFTTNDAWNYFWRRRPAVAAARAAPLNAALPPPAARRSASPG